MWGGYKQSMVDNIGKPPDKMDSLSKDCNSLKKQYDSCFNEWFTEKFAKGGEQMNAAVPCQVVFQAYQHCLKRAMREKKIKKNDIVGDYITTRETPEPRKN